MSFSLSLTFSSKRRSYREAEGRAVKDAVARTHAAYLQTNPVSLLPVPGIPQVQTKAFATRGHFFQAVWLPLVGTRWLQNHRKQKKTNPSEELHSVKTLIKFNPV